jgi:hypothetical protein
MNTYLKFIYQLEQLQKNKKIKFLIYNIESLESIFFLKTFSQIYLASPLLKREVTLDPSLNKNTLLTVPYF